MTAAQLKRDPYDHRIFNRNLPSAQAPRPLSQNTGRRNSQTTETHTGVPRTRRSERRRQSHAQPEGEAPDAGAVAAGLRVSEALDLEVRDLSLDTVTPTLRVRSGKGGKTRLVPVHPELHGALGSALAYGDISQGRIVEAHPATAWRWVQAAVKRAEELGAIAPGKRVGTHTLRHSYARHLLMNGIPINYLSRWLGHSSIQTTLIYPELVSDPTGSLAMVP